MEIDFEKVGQELVDYIITAELFDIQKADPEISDGDVGPYLVLWSANAAEQLGAKMEELLAKV